MKCVRPRYSVIWTLVLLGLAGSVGAARELGRDLPRDFEWVEQLTVEPQSVDQRRSEPQDSFQVRMTAWGHDFEMLLRPADLFADRARNVWVHADGTLRQETPEAIFLSGKLRDDPRSQVRFSLLGEELEGILLTSDEAYMLEPANRFFAGVGPGPLVVYRLSDVDIDWLASQCALDPASYNSLENDTLETEPPRGGAAARSLLDEIRSLEVSGGDREVEIRLVADSFYYGRHRSATASRVQSIIHQINAIYERETGLSFRITETRVWTSRSQDGVSATTDADELIDEFSSPDQVSGNDLAHLFTGRQLNGPVGIARIGGICNTTHATAISQDLSSTAHRIVLAAHEIGHNLGARHDGTGSCQDAPSGFIMWPIVDASARGFSDCSLGSISRRLERAQCIAPEDSEPLPAPQMLAPGGEVTDSAPLFAWQPVQGSESYRLEVYDETMAHLVVDADTGGESFRPSDPLARRHNYRWRISAAGSEGSGQWSLWQDFSILPLAAPHVVAPQGVIGTDQPQFSWQASQGAISYLLEIINEDTDEYSAVATKDLEFQPSSSLEGTRFRWRVSALDEQGTPSPSTWLSFVYRPSRVPSGPRIRP
ncbi:MAG TPA: M12 family metallo-peptidase [Acidobacteriota bacterium]|nr:M12 family metallo-peptidase [Acidobacteriota bacterium]